VVPDILDKGLKPFKQALLSGCKESTAVATVDVEVVPDFIQTLEGSFVGRLGMGVEVRALQTKVWLSGLHEVKVVAMGGELVLISHSEGEELRGPWCKKGWWGGLLFDIRRWTPNMVSSKREIWVNMFGIPLHAWGEATFRALANRCGSFVALDAKTRNRDRLDMARVKVVVPILVHIDFTAKLVVQGASYGVRLVEDYGGVGDNEAEEDQLIPPDGGSCCASGGQAVAMVALDGLDDEVTDSEASDCCQRVGNCVGQVGNKSTFGKQGVEVCGEKSEIRAGAARLIPSINPLVKATGDQILLNSNIEIRGSTSLENVERGGQEVVGQISSANPIMLVESVFPLVKGQVGSPARHVPQAGAGQDFTGGESGSSLGPVQFVIPHSLCGHSLDGPSNQPKENCGVANPAIVTLDNLINNTRGKVVGGVRYSDLSEEGSNDSASLLGK
jgi:hypothetical protein